VGLVSKCKCIYEHVNVYSPSKLRKSQFPLPHIIQDAFKKTVTLFLKKSLLRHTY